MASASRRGAEEYDGWFERPWGRYALSVELGAVLRAVGNLSAGARVLDAGCGTGRFGAALAGRGTVVVGVDPDAAALAIAASRLDHCARAVHHRPALTGVAVGVACESGDEVSLESDVAATDTTEAPTTTPPQRRRDRRRPCPRLRLRPLP